MNSETVAETRTRLLLRDLILSVRSRVRLGDATGFFERLDFVVDDLSAASSTGSSSTPTPTAGPRWPPRRADGPAPL